MDEDALSETLFSAGFTTRDQVSEISGRGVGLDVVRQMLKQLEGSVRLHSTPGAGTRFSLLVPISRAVTRAVAVGVAGETYAFPLLRIERLVQKPARDAELCAQIIKLDQRLPSPFHAARWLLEEWRITLFAQELRAVGAPTAEKILSALKA